LTFAQMQIQGPSLRSKCLWAFFTAPAKYKVPRFARDDVILVFMGTGKIQGPSFVGMTGFMGGGGNTRFLAALEMPVVFL